MGNVTKKRIIVDFDNTMGIRGCDIDDAMALLMVLGSGNAEVVGICTTYGNNRLDVVHSNTRWLLDELGIDIPLYRGAEDASQARSDAAEFLARAAAENPGELSVLATGSLTNLKGAAQIDSGFFSNLGEIAVMGGIQGTLCFGGRIMNELNLSCDPEASFEVMSAPCDVRVAVSQHCLPAFFTKDEFYREFARDSWLGRTCAYWFDDMLDAYKWDGWVCWDAVAAAMLVHPGLFEPCDEAISLNERLLHVGYLERAEGETPSRVLHLPKIADAAEFKRTAFADWHRALAACGLE